MLKNKTGAEREREMKMDRGDVKGKGIVKLKREKRMNSSVQYIEEGIGKILIYVCAGQVTVTSPEDTRSMLAKHPSTQPYSNKEEE